MYASVLQYDNASFCIFCRRELHRVGYLLTVGFSVLVKKVVDTVASHRICT